CDPPVLVGEAVRLQPVPEGLDTVEHLGRPGQEPLLVEVRPEEGLGQLVGGVGGVLVLDLVVPDPEAEREVRALPGLEGRQPGDELLPEPGGGPVLHGVGGALGGRRVLRAVDAQKLVAEEQRRGAAVAAFPHLLEAEADGGAEAQQPFEVGGGEAEAAAVDRALGADDVGVDAVGRRRGARLGRPEDDPQLVHEDLLARPVRLEVGGVEHLAELGLDELVTEDGELHGQVADLVAVGRAGGEPAGVGVVDHHRVVMDQRLDPRAESGQITGGPDRHGRLPSTRHHRSVKWTPTDRIRQHVQIILYNMLRRQRSVSYNPDTLSRRKPRTVESGSWPSPSTPWTGVYCGCSRKGPASACSRSPGGPAWPAVRPRAMSTGSSAAGSSPASHPISTCGRWATASSPSPPSTSPRADSATSWPTSGRSPRSSRPTPPPAPTTCCAGSWPAATTTSKRC